MTCARTESEFFAATTVATGTGKLAGGDGIAAEAVRGDKAGVEEANRDTEGGAGEAAVEGGAVSLAVVP